MTKHSGGLLPSFHRSSHCVYLSSALSTS